jgi:hypothetical protein
MMARQASCQSVSAYVHAVKQHFDELNECLQRPDLMESHAHVTLLESISQDDKSLAFSTKIMAQGSKNTQHPHRPPPKKKKKYSAKKGTVSWISWGKSDMGGKLLRQPLS